MKRILSILLIVYTFFPIVAQNNHVISGKIVGGCFLPMGYYKDLLNKPFSVVAGLEFDYDFLSIDKDPWKKHWNYPSIGVTVLGLKLDGFYGKATPSLGMMFAAYPHINMPLYRSDLGQLRAKLGMGVAVFDRKSLTLGSYAAFNFGLSVNGEFYTSSRGAITLEVAYNPITNGNIYSPNSSMNIFYFAVGGSHLLGYEEHKSPKFYRTKDLKDSWNINISAMASFKNVNLYDKFANSMQGTLHVDGLARINNCWATGPAIDVIYSISAKDDMRFGIAWANGFTVNRVTGLIDAGINIYDHYNKSFSFNEFKFFSNKKDYEGLNGTLYMRLGMRCHIGYNLYVQVSGRSFLHAFDCAEFGLNYSIPQFIKKTNTKKPNKSKQKERTRYINNSKNKQENKQDNNLENRYIKQYESCK